MINMKPLRLVQNVLAKFTSLTHQLEPKKRRKLILTALACVSSIFYVRVSIFEIISSEVLALQGFCLSLFGPTLGDIASQVHETIESVSQGFAVRAAANCLAALICKL